MATVTQFFTQINLILLNLKINWIFLQHISSFYSRTDFKLFSKIYTLRKHKDLQRIIAQLVTALDEEIG